MALNLILLVLLNGYLALRYARLPIGPDEGIWMLWGWTGARPYRDFVDCKPPGIHLWMWFLAHLTGRRIALAKFLHHLTVGSMAVAAYGLTGQLGTGIMATVLLQSAWLMAYQSWMDAISGGFLLLALLTPPWVSVCMVALAVLFNLKAAVPGMVLLVLHGAWLPLISGGITGLVLLGLWRWIAPISLDQVWYGSVVVPRKMQTFRRTTILPEWKTWSQHFSVHLLLIIPAIASAALASQDAALWGAVIAYIVLNAWGGVWRANHSLPLAMVAAAAPQPHHAMLLLLADWGAARLYIGNLWQITYPAIAPILAQAKLVGERLGEEAGTLWVNSFNTQIYVYARKRPSYGVEQLEIREVTPELAAQREHALREHAPQYIVIGPGHLAGEPRGYQKVGEVGTFAILG